MPAYNSPGSRPPATLRASRPEDLPALHALSLEVGWPHRLEDWRLMAGLGHGLLAQDDEGQVGGCAFRWEFGSASGTVGLVIVAARLRGQGIGRLLMGRVLDEGGARRFLLNATPDGRPLYESLGFRAVGSVEQRQGFVKDAPALMDAGLHRLARPDDRDAILALDTDAAGAGRKHLLDTLAETGTGHVLERHGRVAGFAFTRRFGRGWLAGPIAALDDEAACALVAPALAQARGRFLRLDTPVVAGPFTALLEGAGLARADTALTMVRGGEPSKAADGPRVYGLAAQALG